MHYCQQLLSTDANRDHFRGPWAQVVPECDREDENASGRGSAGLLVHECPKMEGRH